MILDRSWCLYMYNLISSSVLWMAQYSSRRFPIILQNKTENIIGAFISILLKTSADFVTFIICFSALVRQVVTASITAILILRVQSIRRTFVAYSTTAGTLYRECIYVSTSCCDRPCLVSRDVRLFCPSRAPHLHTPSHASIFNVLIRQRTRGLWSCVSSSPQTDRPPTRHRLKSTSNSPLHNVESHEKINNNNNVGLAAECECVWARSDVDVSA